MSSLLNLLKSKLAGNVFWLALAEIAGRGSIILGSIYLARVLGTAGFGLFTLAQTTVFYFWFAVDLGIAMYGIREIAKAGKASRSITDTLLTMRMVFGLVTYLVLVLIVFLSPMPLEKQQVFYACGLYLVFYAVYPDWIAKGFQSFKVLSLSSVVYLIVFLTTLFLLVKSKDDLVAAGLVWSLSYIISALVLFWLLQKHFNFGFRPDFSKDNWKHHLGESMFFTFSGLLTLVYHYAPVYSLALFESDHAVGLFAAPFRIILVVGASGFILLMAVYPSMSAIHKTDPDHFFKQQKRLNLSMAGIGVAIAMMGTLFASPLILLLFGEEYRQSIPVFQILIWLIPLYFIRNANGTALQAASHQKKHNLAAGIAAITSIIVSTSLIPAFGLSAAAWVLIIAELAFTLSMVYFFQSLSKKHYAT